MSVQDAGAVTCPSELFDRFLRRLREPESRVQVHTPNPLGDDTSGHDPRVILDHFANQDARIERLRAALDTIGAMFYVGTMGAVLLKPDFGNYDVLDAANAALAINQQSVAEKSK